MSAQGAADGLPTCDTCGSLAVWNETLGWVHSTERWPHGVPPHLNRFGHEATAVAWVRGESRD